MKLCILDFVVKVPDCSSDERKHVAHCCMAQNFVFDGAFPLHITYSIYLDSFGSNKMFVLLSPQVQTVLKITLSFDWDTQHTAHSTIIVFCFSVEELVCLATWKDGSTWYLVGKLHHAMAQSDEDRYRCFVYERSQGQGRERRSTYDVAQSGDATCNGLLSAKEGSRTMRLTKSK